MLDTSYLLPTFGVDIDFATADDIRKVLDKCIKNHIVLYLSEISILEAYLKALSLARKKNKRLLFNRAVDAYFIIKASPLLHKITYDEYEILATAAEIMRTHRDPFDAIIISTALVENIPVASEDDDFADYLPEKLLVSWNDFKKII